MICYTVQGKLYSVYVYTAKYSLYCILPVWLQAEYNNNNEKMQILVNYVATGYNYI